MRVVAFIGPPKGGKTALLASPYECFQIGEFAGRSFAGSDTLVGFERVSHLGRLASRLHKPDTERTRSGPHHCFHLRVWSGNTGSGNVLLSNISGEDCDAAVDSSEDCKRLQILRRADHVVLVLDCGALCDTKTRQDARNYATTLLRSLVESEMIGFRSIIDIVFNKWDLVESHPQRQDSIAFLEVVEADMRNRFLSLFGALTFYRTAARPEYGPLLPGHGVDALFSSWLRESRLTQQRLRSLSPTTLPIAEFDRYEHRFHFVEGGEV